MVQLEVRPEVGWTDVESEAVDATLLGRLDVLCPLLTSLATCEAHLENN